MRSRIEKETRAVAKIPGKGYIKVTKDNGDWLNLRYQEVKFVQEIREATSYSIGKRNWRDRQLKAFSSTSLPLDDIRFDFIQIDVEAISL